MNISVCVCVYSKSTTDVEAAHEVLSVHNGVKLDNDALNLFKSILPIISILSVLFPSRSSHSGGFVLHCVSHILKF